MTGRESGTGRRAGWLIAAAVALGVAGGVALERSGTSLGPLEVDTSGIVEQAIVRHEPPEPERSGQPPLAPESALAGLPAYPDASPLGLGDSFQARGTPLSIAWFTTADMPEDVVAWYEKALGEAGLPAVSQMVGPGFGYIGYKEPDTEVMHTVTVVRQGEETMVFPSAGNAERLLEGEDNIPESLPHPEGAVGSMVMTVEEGGNLQTSVVAFVPLGRIPDLVEFYRAGLVEKGWTLSRMRQPSMTQAMFTATRGSTTAEGVLERREITRDGPQVQLFIMLTTRKEAT